METQAWTQLGTRWLVRGQRAHWQPAHPLGIPAVTMVLVTATLASIVSVLLQGRVASTHPLTHVASTSHWPQIQARAGGALGAPQLVAPGGGIQPSGRPFPHTWQTSLPAEAFRSITSATGPVLGRRCQVAGKREQALLP